MYNATIANDRLRLFENKRLFIVPLLVFFAELLKLAPAAKTVAANVRRLERTRGLDMTIPLCRRI
jgi:hypothetical protein